MNGENEQLEWIHCYRSALLELDQKKLRQRIELADQAIRLRLAQSGPVDPQEQQAIRDALQNLRVLQKELQDAMEGRRPAHEHPEISGEYVVFVDTNRRYLEVTDGVCRLLGYSREELLGKTIDDVTAPELRDRVSNTFEQYLQAGGLAGNYLLVSRDGQRVPIRYESKVFPDGCLVARWEPIRSAA